MATVEQALRCPKCKTQGEVKSVVTVRARDGSPAKLHTAKCMNPSCNWYDTAWIIQENSDGSVPERDGGHEPKTFPTLNRTLTQKEALAFVEASTRDEILDPDTARLPGEDDGRA